jgi:hypothetical protein
MTDDMMHEEPMRLGAGVDSSFCLTRGLEDAGADSPIGRDWEGFRM